MKTSVVEKYIKPLLIRAQSSYIVAFFLLPLKVLSFLFLGIIYVRKKVLLCKGHTLQAKIVTVGNVSFGGTGKTPFLLLLLHQFNRNVAYVSRGYRRKEKKPFIGKGKECSASSCGDEAVQIAKRFPNICVSIAKDKWEAVERIKNIPLIFLDDGLQRYDVPRDIEIATVDVTCPDGYGGLFPRGFLREPLSRLKEVDYIVLTNIQERDCAEKLCDEYEAKFSRPVIACQMQITRFFDAQGKTVIPHQKVALFSAIASPERVRALMERYGFEIVDHLIFPDHVDIDLNSVYNFYERVRTEGATAIIGTEKDFVKKECWPDLPLFFSEVNFEVVAGKENFEKLIDRIGEYV